MTIGGPEGHEI